MATPRSDESITCITATTTWATRQICDTKHLSNSCNASKDKEARDRDVPGIEQVLPVLITKGVACKGMAVSGKHLQVACHLCAGMHADGAICG